MRCAHHNSILIRQHRIVRVIFVERIIPHGRPEIIGLQPQHELEEIRVKRLIVIGHPRRHRGIGTGRHRAIFHRNPIAQIRRFVI